MLHARPVRVFSGLGIAGVLMFVGSAAARLSPTIDAQAPTPTPSTQAPVARQSLIVMGDTVRGAAGVAPQEMLSLVCTQQNRYPQGSTVVFRMQVLDSTTQQSLDPSQVQGVTLTLPDGTSAPFHYTQLSDEPGADSAWTATWLIPDDYPTGVVDVHVTAVDMQGRTGAWRQYNVPDSQLQVVPKGER